MGRTTRAGRRGPASRRRAFRTGAIPNPTRRLLLGDPVGGVVYGCVIELKCVDELANGMTLRARYLFWPPEAHSSSSLSQNEVSRSP